MLKSEIVELIESYYKGDVSRDGHFLHKSKDISLQWDCSMVGDYYKDKSFTIKEQNLIESLIKNNELKDTELESILDFICWVNDTFPFGGWDYKDHMIFGDVQSSIKYDICDESTPKGNGMTFWYWTTHYQIEYFEKVLPHYIENIRSILREKLDLNFSDYLHKYHSHMIYEEEQKMSDFHFPHNEEVENVT